MERAMLAAADASRGVGPLPTAAVAASVTKGVDVVTPGVALVPPAVTTDDARGRRPLVSHPLYDVEVHTSWCDVGGLYDVDDSVDGGACTSVDGGSDPEPPVGHHIGSGSGSCLTGSSPSSATTSGQQLRLRSCKGAAGSSSSSSGRRPPRPPPSPSLQQASPRLPKTTEHQDVTSASASASAASAASSSVPTTAVDSNGEGLLYDLD